MVFKSVCFVSGVILLQQMSSLPAPAYAVVGLMTAFIAIRHLPIPGLGWLLFGWSWALGAACLSMQERLDPRFEGRDLMIQGRILGIPQKFEHGLRFGFAIESNDQAPDPSIPSRVRLSWYAPPPAIKAGQSWRLQVRLKQPHGSLNPGAFDYERWLFLQGYRATGYVRANASNRLLDDGGGMLIDRLRQTIAERIAAQFNQSPVNGMLQALVIGERSGIDESQWEILRKTGTAHLLAISGLHIGLVAGFAYLIAQWLWLRIGSPRISSPALGAIGAIAAALFYAALAGFSLPTRRALIMIALVMGGILARRKVLVSHTLALALFLIVLCNPASVLSAGMGLSFGAVALIVYALGGRLGKSPSWLAIGKIHVLTAFGLSPLLLLYFRQFSVIAPIANALAVPIVGAVVVPAGLLGTALLGLLPQAGAAVLSIAVTTLETLWHYLEWLANLHFAQVRWVQPGLGSVCAALAGLLLAFAPRGIRARWLAFPILLPLAFPAQDHPKAGEFQLTLLDVGQGLSAIVETKRHTLVFDTGARFSDRLDMGSAVVAPFLRSRNIRNIDRLVISHADNDHLGGARSLDVLFPINRIDTSARDAIDWRQTRPCRQGQHWIWDGVDFNMLAPFGEHPERENDNSCVLRIQSRSQSILLTGDIERRSELELVQRYGPALSSDYLVLAHHGSNTSSNPEFLAAVRPKYALVSAGYRNRYGFPRSQVIERLQRIGAKLFNTADSGAIRIATEAGISPARPRAYRKSAQKYYHFQAASPD